MSYSRKDWVLDGVLNFAWVAVTALLLAVLHVAWPDQSWLWGLLLGSSVGGSTVFIVARIARWVRRRD